MKKKLFRIFGIITLALMACMQTVGCGRESSAESHPRGNGWPEVSSEVDALTDSLDAAIYGRRGSAKCVDSLMRGLQRCGDLLADDSELRGRIDFFRASVIARDSGGEVARQYAVKAMQRVDSQSHPYLYNRMSMLSEDADERSVEAFDRMTARIAYFSSIHDDFMTASQYTRMGNMLKNVRSPLQAIEAYARADSLYKSAGYPEFVLFNSMNRASAMTQTGDTAGAIAIYRQLLPRPEVEGQPDIKAMILSNLYQYSEQAEVLDSLLMVEGDSPDALTLYFLAERQRREGRAEDAISTARQCMELAAEAGDADTYALGAYELAGALADTGRKGEAYDMLYEAQELTDAVDLAVEPERVRLEQLGHAIEMRRLEREMARDRRMFRIACIGFVVFLALAIALWVITLRIQRLRHQRELAKRERDEVSRRLIATQVAMDETEGLIDSVGKEIGNMADSGRLPDGETRSLVRTIRSHSVRRAERESFVESFSAMHPDFGARLREINPAITEPDIRLASYVALGMDTKHIAATMRIRPESVKQGRWRLRTKLGLTRADSLEERLRRLL